MTRENTRKIITGVANIVAVIAGIMVLISLFMPYLRHNVANVPNSLGTGFDYMMNKNNSSSGKLMAYLVLCLIFALALAVLAVLRLIKMPLFNSKLMSFMFAIDAIALLILSIMTFTAFKNSSSLSLVSNGAGLIVNLIFSIIAFLAALVSAGMTAMLNVNK